MRGLTCNAVSTLFDPPPGKLAFVLVYALSTLGLSAQQASTAKPRLPVFRSPDAVQVITNSLAALGGAGAWSSVQTWSVDGISTLKSQHRPEHWAVSPGTYRIECDDPSGAIITTSDQNGATRQNASGSIKVPLHVERANVIPFLIGSILQKELNDPAYSIELISADPVNNIAAIRTISHHSTLDELVTPQIWYFDIATKLPSKLSFHEESSKAPVAFAWGTLVFNDFRPSGSTLVPFQWSESIGNQVVETTQLTAVNQQ